MEELYVVFGRISGLVCTEISFSHPASFASRVVFGNTEKGYV